MRRQLVWAFVGLSTLVTLAFVVPLGFLVRTTAEDRAIDAARADAAAVIPALVAESTPAQVEATVSTTESGVEGRMTVVSSQGWVVGPEITDSPAVVSALSSGESSITAVDDGVEVVAAVAAGAGELSAIRVHVPSADLHRGQWRAWTVLAGVGAVLVALSVFVADRVSRSIVEPARRLASTAGRLSAGDLEARVELEGPAELAEIGVAFNDIGDRVSSMLVRERELIAELSHRLRTPLTKLRMRADQVEDRELSGSLLADIDDLTLVVNGLIVEARGASGESELCDLNVVATDRAEFWQVLAEDQLRPWSFSSWGNPLVVPVSASDLAAAIDALIDNVFAHTPERTALSIRCASHEGCAELVVGDAGPGFDGVQSQRGRSGSGSTGLGLDIATRLAEGAGGELQVEPSALGGVAVTLRLPTRG